MALADSDQEHTSSDEQHSSSDATVPYNLDADDESSDNESITPQHHDRRIPRKFKDFVLT